MGKSKKTVKARTPEVQKSKKTVGSDKKKIVPIKPNGIENVAKKIPASKISSSCQNSTPHKSEAKNKVLKSASSENKHTGNQTPGNNTLGKQMPGKQTPAENRELKQVGKKVKESKAVSSIQKMKKEKSPKVETPKEKLSTKKRTRDSSSGADDDDDDDDDNEKPGMKMAKTSSSPEMKILQKTASQSKVIPDNEVVFPLKDKSKMKPKTSRTLHGVKRSRKEVDYEDDDDNDDDGDVTSEAKTIKKDKNAKQSLGPKVAAKNVLESNSYGNISADAAKDMQFKAYIDKFKLFIKGFEPDVTEEEIKALSADIQDVQPCKLYAKQRNKKGHAYLVFKDEKTADANFKLLTGRKLRGEKITVDYVGEKSRNSKPMVVIKERELDLLRLYVRGFGSGTESDLKLLFPTADKVEIPLKNDGSPSCYAFVTYKTEAECRAAHEQVQGKVINGTLLQIFYANKSSRQKSTVPQSSTVKNDNRAVAKVASDVDKKKIAASNEDKNKKIAADKKVKNVKNDSNEEEDMSDDDDDDDDDDADDDVDDDDDD